MEHADLDEIVREVVQRRIDRLHAALHVRLHHHREFDDVRLKVAEHRVEVRRGERRALLGRLLLTVLRNLAGTLLVLDHGKLVARHRHAAEAQDLDRHRGAGFLDLLALVVDQRAHAAALGADHESVAPLERAARDEHGRNRAAALVELRLDHRRVGRTVGVGLELQ